MGEESSSGFIEALRDINKAVRVAAVEGLRILAQGDEEQPSAQATGEILTTVLEALSDTDKHVRVVAAGSFAGLGRQNGEQPMAEAIEALREALSDADKEVRAVAAEGLGYLGQVLPEMTEPLLTGISESQVWQVRRNCAVFLSQSPRDYDHTIVLYCGGWRTRLMTCAMPVLRRWQT